MPPVLRKVLTRTVTVHATSTTSTFRRRVVAGPWNRRCRSNLDVDPRSQGGDQSCCFRGGPWFTGIVGLAAALSPSVMMGVERGNLDLLILILVGASALIYNERRSAPFVVARASSLGAS